MFKFIKKIMISLINAIRSLFVGDKEVQSVSIGNTVVYQSGSEYVLDSVSLSFSNGGSKLNAAGTNYAQITGTFNVYRNGVLTGTDTMTLTPVLSNNSFLSISDGTKITAPDRTNVEGAERSESVGAQYTIAGTTYQAGNVTITQQQNQRVLSSGLITDFKINGQATSLVISDSSTTLYISSISGYENVDYTSGYHTTISIPNYTYSCSQAGSWVTMNYNGNQLLNISIAANTSGSDRQAVIEVRDAQFSGVTNSVTIRQEAPWILSVNSKTILATDTSFYIQVTSTTNGTPYPITANMVDVTTNASSIALTDITDIGNGVYRLDFNCSINSDTTNSKTNRITITRPDHSSSPVVSTITQLANSSAFDGLHIITTAENNNHWAFGTYSAGRVQMGSYNYENLGIVIVADAPIASDVTVRFNKLVIQRITNPSSQPVGVAYNVTRYSTQTITAGSTFGIGNKTYYGAWLYVPDISWSSTDGWISGSGITFNPVPTTSVNEVNISIL